MTLNTIIPLTTMKIIITIRSAHIGFEEAGIDDDTSVRNIAYESKMVIARPTRSPDSTGVTGKDVANMLDTIFFYSSYVVMVITTLGYILYVFL
jgi:hypothetical protein